MVSQFLRVSLEQQGYEVTGQNTQQYDAEYDNDINNCALLTHHE